MPLSSRHEWDTTTLNPGAFLIPAPWRPSGDIRISRGWPRSLAFGDRGYHYDSRPAFMTTAANMVRPERFELPAFWFVARRSIQLSYGRTWFGDEPLSE
jgi:hypothetical protein